MGGGGGTCRGDSGLSAASGAMDRRNYVISRRNYVTACGNRNAGVSSRGEPLAKLAWTPGSTDAGGSGGT